MPEWPLRRLGDLTENFDALRVPVRESDRRPGPYAYYGASGVVDHVDGYLFEGDHLLVAEDGENLRTRSTPIAFMASGKFWVNNHAHIVRGNAHADTRFLMYALAVADIRGYLTGSTMPKLTQGNLNRIPVHAPPLPEQHAIARVLGALDDKIELNQRMGETLEAMAGALFKSWFVDFDPVRAKVEERALGLADDVANVFPDAMVEVGDREVPEGWRVRPVGDLADVLGGTTPRTDQPMYWVGGTHPWATPKDLANLRAPVLLDTDRHVTDAGLSQIGSGLLPRGTVLMSSRAPIGYLAVSEVPTAINQGFIAMVAEPGVSNLFLLHWARASQDAIVARANGSTFLEISKANFRPIPVVVPPSPVMAAFDAIARPLFERLVTCERETRTLAALRDTLLPRLMSGEVRIGHGRVDRDLMVRAT